jgi:hypothetical protein
MAELLYFLALLVAVPGGVAWLGGRLVPSRNLVWAWLVVVCSAVIPFLWILFATQDADGITRAAGIALAPVLFVFSLLSAAVGYKFAHSKAP